MPGVYFPSRFISKDFKKMVFTASLLGTKKKDSMDCKQEILLVVSLGKTFDGMPLPLCGRQVAGLSSLPVVVAQSN